MIARFLDLQENAVIKSLSKDQIRSYAESVYKKHPPTEQSKREHHHISPAPADFEEMLSAPTGEIPSNFQDIKAFFCKTWFALGRLSRTTARFMPENHYYQKIHVYFYKEEDDSWYTSGFARMDGLVQKSTCPPEDIPFLYKNLTLAMKMLSHCRDGREAKDLMQQMVRGNTKWRWKPGELE